MKKQQNHNGFTLIEISVVLVILAILMAIMIPALTGYIKNAREKTCALQRSSMERYFKAAYLYEQELRMKSPEEVKKVIDAGGGIVAYLCAADKRYYENPDAKCMTSGKPYTYTVDRVNDIFLMKIICDCPSNSSNFLGELDKIVDTSNKIFNENGYKPTQDRTTLIKEMYNKNNGLPKVSAVFLKNTGFDKKELYWRPYHLKDGTMVLYASEKNDTTHSGWNAYLVYVNGEVYVSNKKKWNDTKDGTSIADFSDDTKNTIAKQLENSKFTVKM